MRKTGVACVLAALIGVQAPLDCMAESTFEGVITATTTIDGDSVDIILHVKDTRSRIEVIADGERTIIIRNKEGKVVGLLEESREYFVSPVRPEGEGEKTRFIPTGRSETVAGYACDYYRMDDPSGIQDGDEACVTTELGFVGFGLAGSPVWEDEDAIREQFRDGFLILKSLDANGAVDYVVTKVEPAALSDSLFEPPSDYTELKLPGGVPPAR
jgi:hypothetical protein